MFANSRYDIILDILNINGSVSVSSLTQKFNVSLETVRRDLEFLEKTGKLQRVHGGAISINKKNSFYSMEQRLMEHCTEKRELCETAMQFIDNGNVIAVDSGSTAVEFASVLKNSGKTVTVVTYSSEVFHILSDCQNINLIVTGGQYLSKENAFYGGFAKDMLCNFHVDRGFIFPSAISLKYGVYDFVPELIDMQKQILGISDNIYILADNSKFEKTANIRITNNITNSTIVTDSKLSNAIYDLYKKNNINIVLHN